MGYAGSSTHVGHQDIRATATPPAVGQVSFRKQLTCPELKADYNRQLDHWKDFWSPVANTDLSDGMMFHLGGRHDIELQIA